MTVPYNNGKIKMGIAYKPTPYIENDPDMILLQTYLIQDPAMLRKRYWLRKAYWGALVFTVFVIWLYN